MKISSKEITVAQATRAGVALGHHLGLLDNARNTRAATREEMEEFCFSPLRQITMKYERGIAEAAALAAAQIDVPAFDQASN